MPITSVKESLHELIDKIEDEELLNAYLKIIERGLPVLNDPIVGYTTSGEPISKSNLVHQVQAASERVKSGQYILQEDIEKESENW